MSPRPTRSDKLVKSKLEACSAAPGRSRWAMLCLPGAVLHSSWHGLLLEHAGACDTTARSRAADQHQGGFPHRRSTQCHGCWRTSPDGWEELGRINRLFSSSTMPRNQTTISEVACTLGGRRNQCRPKQPWSLKMGLTGTKSLLLGRVKLSRLNSNSRRSAELLVLSPPTFAGRQTGSVPNHNLDRPSEPKVAS